MRCRTGDSRRRGTRPELRTAKRRPPIFEPLESRTLLASLPNGFNETPVAAGLSNATAMEFAPNGDLWVLEQGGAVKRFPPGSTSADVVGNASALGLSSAGERGLLGIAFDPQYGTNKFVYLYYTAISPAIHNRISRFTVNDSDAADYFFVGASAGGSDAGAGGTPTQTIIFDLDNLTSATNHNGGAIHFGPDGKLYAAVGDNASGGNAQTLVNVLGKMLRMNSDGTAPSDNPFFAQTTGKQQTIWALGLRNPYTFAFQPGTGRLFINDVGLSAWEEIDDGIPGSNYGWPSMEGNAGTPPTGPGTYRGPLYTYSHGSGTFQGFAIAGGAFYNPSVQQFPAAFAGDYFFADYVNDWINVLDVVSGGVTRFASDAPGTVDLRVTTDGSLYYLARNANQVFRVNFSSNQAPVAVNDDYLADEDKALIVNVLNGVLANDADTPGSVLTAALLAGAAHGVVALNPDGSFSYTPDPDYDGPDSFTYQASDGQLLSNVATVSLTVRPVNDRPTISNIDDQTIDQDTVHTVPFTIGDVETPAADLIVSVAAVNQALLPAGSLVVRGSGATRTLDIIPAPRQSGSATIQITISDGELTASTSFLLTVSVEPHPWHNKRNALDVDDDGQVTPLDVLFIINMINSRGTGPLPPPTPLFSPPPYVDVLPDNILAPIDALLVINHLNAQAPPPPPEGEGFNGPTAESVSGSLDDLLAVDPGQPAAMQRRSPPFA